MRKFILLLWLLLNLLLWLLKLRDIHYTTNAQVLFGTDDLGRTLLQNDAVGNPKPGRHVAMFYFLWQTSSRISPNVWDLYELYANHPEVFEDCDNPNWGSSKGKYYFWGQPIYGYYSGDDYWVHLRNIQLLTDAGVDLLVIDATNGDIFPLQSEALMKAMDFVRMQGKIPPRIVYYTNTNSGETIQEIYQTFYADNAPCRHSECWFYLDGKPLIIGVSEDVEKTLSDFFTIRESQWPSESQRINGWPWISFTRKPEVHYNKRGEKEIISVSCAQNPSVGGMGGQAFYGYMLLTDWGDIDSWGRSFRKNTHGNSATDIFYGYNFQEQWDYALEEDVPFIFVTSWNEWIAGRWDSHDPNPKHSWFCDQASPEYSRDIEPTLTAGLKDLYYMQLVNNIRRYKGVEKNNEIRSNNVAINNLSAWGRVNCAVYTDYIGEVQHRNHPGAQSDPVTIYTNTTGLNDFHIMKVAHDKKNLYFYVETVDDITPNTGDNWMRLYLDADKDFNTGWKGYDYRIVGGTTLQHYVNSEWKTVNEKKPFKNIIEKNRMMITVPRSLLLKSGKINFEFKWTDNMQVEDPMDWYVNGDTAPGGRFNYGYIEKEKTRKNKN